MTALQTHWARLTPVSIALLPLAGLFAGVVRLRRLAYSLGWKSSFAVDVPVWVVGNITAGGSGKTPMVIWLVNWLVQQGFRPGVISRGYRGSAKGCAEVLADSDPAQVGDEPLLIHFKTHVPVVIGRDRLAAAQTLLQRHPEVNILVSDDGLQHYRLQRQLEIAVIDASTGVGNGLPLPSGPLREPVSRLKTVDAVIRVNRKEILPRSLRPPFYQAAFRLGNAYALCAPLRKTHANNLPTGPWLAITGIGHPQGFFSMLDQLGWSFKTKTFPDHHRFTCGDIPANDPVVMTEKDAVKCSTFARKDWWALELEVQPEPALIEYLLTRTMLLDVPNRTRSPIESVPEAHSRKRDE